MGILGHPANQLIVATLVLIAVRIAIVIDVTFFDVIVCIHIVIIIRISVKTGHRTVDLIRIHGTRLAVISEYPYINSISLFIQT